MIDRYVEIYNTEKQVLRKRLKKLVQQNTDECDEYTYFEYGALVTCLIQFLNSFNDGYESAPQLDPGRITEVDHGDYQGTLVYVIGATGYQPNEYVVTKVHYGSCSVCDTLKSILEDTHNQEQQLDDLLILCLHIIQQMKLI